MSTFGKIKILGNAGAIVDGVPGSAAPANAFQIAGSDGSNLRVVKVDANGQITCLDGIVLTTGTVINSTNGTLNAVFAIATGGAPSILVQLDQTTTITAGAIKFQVSYDGTNFVDLSADAILDPTSTTLATIAQPYTLQANTKKPFLLMLKGAQALQLLVSTAMTGSGAITPFYAQLAYSPLQQTTVLNTVKTDGSAVNQPVVPAAPTTMLTTSAVINFSSSGDNTVITGLSAKTIRVMRMILVVAAATNLTFKDGASTSLSGAIPMLANGSITLDDSGEPWYLTSAANNFVINSSVSVSVQGTIWYTQS